MELPNQTINDEKSLTPIKTFFSKNRKLLGENLFKGFIHGVGILLLFVLAEYWQ